MPAAATRIGGARIRGVRRDSLRGRFPCRGGAGLVAVVSRERATGWAIALDDASAWGMRRCYGLQ